MEEFLSANVFMGQRENGSTLRQDVAPGSHNLDGLVGGIGEAAPSLERAWLREQRLRRYGHAATQQPQPPQELSPQGPESQSYPA